jgi:predicted  nucleic acid-binding Zn-ribbon protein
MANPIFDKIEDLYVEIRNLNHKFDSSGTAPIEPFEKQLEQFKTKFNQHALATELSKEFSTHVKYHMDQVEVLFDKMQRLIEQSASIKESSFLANLKSELKMLEETEEKYAEIEDKISDIATEIEDIESNMEYEKGKSKVTASSVVANFLKK